MDPVTHLAAGILIAQSIEPHHVSLYGLAGAAIASQLPDLDFLTKKVGSSTLFLKLHHKLGHSVLVLLPLALLLAWGLSLLSAETGFGRLFLIICLTLVSHLLLDILIHGPGMTLLWPLSDRKIGLSLVMGPNPLTASAQCFRRSLAVCVRCQLHGSLYMTVFYLVFAGALLSLVFSHHAGKIGLIVCLIFVVYLAQCFLLKTRATRLWRSTMNIPPGTRFDVVPGGYQPWRWFGLVQTGPLIETGFIDCRTGTVWDRTSYTNAEDNQFILKSKETETVRHFLEEAMFPHVSMITDNERIEVRWREISYAFATDIDIFMAKVILSADGQVLSHEFRERW